MTNSGSADETESEMRTRKTRQTACSRKRIWKARARQKSPRIVFEADLWKMLKNSTPWVWLERMEFFSFFQHFSAFWKLMNAHFSKNSCYSRYSIINEWSQCAVWEIPGSRYTHVTGGGGAMYACSGFCMPFRGTSTWVRVGHTFI